MGTGKSYDQVQYEKSVAASKDPASMTYGQIPRAPGQSWNDYMTQNSAFQKTYSGPGLATSRSAMNQLMNPSGISGRGSVSSFGGSYGGGGGGSIGGGMTNPLGISFYNPNTPQLQGVTQDFSQANKPYQQQAAQALPDYMSVVKSQLSAAKQGAAGQTSKTLAGNIARSSAQAGLSTGLASGGIQRNSTARDFGLTSEDLISRSVGLLQGAAQGYQNFFNVSNPISPNYLFETGVNQAFYNSGIANQQGMMNYMNTATPGQYDISKGAFVGFQPGSYSATMPQLQTGTRTQYKYKDAYGKGYGPTKQVPTYTSNWASNGFNRLG
jgi:hypothetical protein